MNPPRTHQSPGFLRIVGAIALAIVLAVGGSFAVAGFLTDWGRRGNPDSRPPPSQASPRPPAPPPRQARRHRPAMEMSKLLRH